MSYSRERDEFISLATQEGLSLDTCRRLLRYASTLQRLAEAQCNGDWPYNGDRDWPNAESVTCGPCNGSGKTEHTGLECVSCHGNGKLWFRNAKLDAQHDRHYTVCPKCEASGVAKGSMRLSHENGIPKSQYPAERVKVCPDCRTQELVTALLSQANCQRCTGGRVVADGLNLKCNCDVIKPIFQGDPRGAVLLLATPGYPWSEDGRGRGLYVPARPTPCPR